MKFSICGNKKEKKTRFFLAIYLGITFGLSWGMSILYVLFIMVS